MEGVWQMLTLADKVGRGVKNDDSTDKNALKNYATLSLNQEVPKNAKKCQNLTKCAKMCQKVHKV